MPRIVAIRRLVGYNYPYEKNVKKALAGVLSLDVASGDMESFWSICSNGLGE